MTADEIVQVYARNLESPGLSVEEETGRIRAGDRVKPGAEEILSLDVPVERLSYWDSQQKRFVEPGDFELQIGASSEDIRPAQTITVVPDRAAMLMSS